LIVSIAIFEGIGFFAGGLEGIEQISLRFGILDITFICGYEYVANSRRHSEDVRNLD